MWIFDWWPQINETLNDSFEKSTDPLKGLDWENLPLDGGGLFNTNKNPDDSKWVSPDKIQKYVDSQQIAEAQVIENYHNNLEDYSDTWTEEEYQEKTIEENEKIELRNLEESPLFPIVERLYNEKNPKASLISNESYDSLLQNFNVDTHEFDLENLVIDNKNDKLVIDEYFHKSDIEANKVEFYKTFKSNIDWRVNNKENKSVENDKHLIKLVWEWYINFESKEKWRINQWADLKTAFNIAWNKLIKKWWDSIKKDDEFYWKIDTLKNANTFDKLLDSLSDLDKLINNTTNKFKSTQSKAFEKRKEQSFENIKINKEFAEFLIEYIQQNTTETKEWTQKLIDITNELLNKPDKIISPDKKLEIFNEVKEILWEQA